MNTVMLSASYAEEALENAIQTAFHLKISPFVHTEASSDLELSRYFVGNELVSVLLTESPALIFAPSGGGKTAARLYATHACWFALGGPQLFPLPYIPKTNNAETPEQHRWAIARSGAAALLLGLIHRPALFLESQSLQQRAVVAYLKRLLPRPLLYYIELLRSGQTYRKLAARLAPSYLLPAPLDAVNLKPLLDQLERLAHEPSGPMPRGDAFDQLQELLLDQLRFRGVLLQIDGVDASPETARLLGINLDAMRKLVAWPLLQTEHWAQQQIFVKASLPAELEPSLLTQFPELQRLSITRVEWSVTQLAEVLRQRVYFASDEKFDSLSKVSSPALRELETTLATIAKPLPRELLWLTNCLFQAYAARIASSRFAVLLEPRDVELAMRLYRQQY